MLVGWLAVPLSLSRLYSLYRYASYACTFAQSRPDLLRVSPVGVPITRLDLDRSLVSSIDSKRRMMAPLAKLVIPFKLAGTTTELAVGLAPDNVEQPGSWC